VLPVIFRKSLLDTSMISSLLQMNSLSAVYCMNDSSYVMI
jgi:hypothetical protein